MPEKKLYPFVLNDENVINSYGFRVRNSGIDFKRFDANPVMLADHINKTENVRGNWKNRRIEASKLWMDGNFDTDLPAGEVLQGQVEREFVKGASLGLAIDWSTDPFERQPDGNWDLVKSQACEGTVCAIPSNSGALCQLFDMSTGELITEEQLKLSFVKLNAEFKKPNNLNMDKIILSTQAVQVLVGLNVANTEDVNHISNAIVNLNSKVTDAEKSAKDWKEKYENQAKLQAETLVDNAIANEQLTAGDREDWLQLAIANFSLASKQIGKIPGKVSLMGKVIGGGGAGGDAAVKTIDDFEKLSNDAKLAFKTNNLDAYKALFAKN